MEVTKLKIENLINKRQLAIHMLSIVIGGIIGLLFLPTDIKTIILMLLGLYYAAMLSTNYVKLNNEIEKLIYELEQTK